MTTYTAIAVGDDDIKVPGATTAKRAAENARPYIKPGETVAVLGPRGGLTYWTVGAIGSFKTKAAA